MSIRARILTLFLLLAAVPLLALGGIEYVRLFRAAERLIAAENGRIAARAARVIETRGALLESDLLLLAENAETQRWLVSRAEGREEEGAEQEGRRFLDEAWSRLGAGYAGFRLHDAEGQTLYVTGREESLTAPFSGPFDPVDRPIRDLASGRTIGALRLALVPEAMVPLDVLGTGLGESGFGMVLDRPSGRVLYHPSAGVLSRPAAEVFGTSFGRDGLDGCLDTFRSRVGDTVWVASRAAVSTLPWDVVVSGSVNELAAPFADVGRSTLLLFLAVTVLATVAFGAFLSRTTRSLEQLSTAASVVGQGDFAPRLPKAGPDEVGRLTASFEVMVGRVREMLEEVQASRQMAVLGQFAAQLAHEIRNPLTSIKLNLQKIEREARSGSVPERAEVPLGIALREVARLDEVVRGVLELARQAPGPREDRSLHELVREIVEVVAEQARAQAVHVELSLEARADTVAVNAARIKGALLNLVLNALEAMPRGGVLRIGSQDLAGMIRLEVSDTGQGIPRERRRGIFQPFVTTKEGGTGLGLPLARRAIEEHGGTLDLDDRPGGALLVVHLPLVSA